jgi:hypothetical protein
MNAALVDSESCMKSIYEQHKMLVAFSEALNRMIELATIAS